MWAWRSSCLPSRCGPKASASLACQVSLGTATSVTGRGVRQGEHGISALDPVSLTLRDPVVRGQMPFHKDFLITTGKRRELKVRTANTCYQEILPTSCRGCWGPTFPACSGHTRQGTPQSCLEGDPNWPPGTWHVQLGLRQESTGFAPQGTRARSGCAHGEAAP